jgi:hypothetical protein
MKKEVRLQNSESSPGIAGGESRPRDANVLPLRECALHHQRPPKVHDLHLRFQMQQLQFEAHQMFRRAAMRALCAQWSELPLSGCR